jgi:alpha-L-fucosidase
LLHEADVRSLAGFGDRLARIFSIDFAKKAKLTVTNTRGNDARAFGASKLTDGDRYSYWATDDAITEASVELSWSSPQTFDLIRLREDIRLGQRIDSLAIDVFDGSTWTTAGTATSIGACRLVRFDRAVTTNKLRVRIISSPVCPALSEIGVFDISK